MTHLEFNYNVLTDIFRYLKDGDVSQLIVALRSTERRIWQIDGRKSLKHNYIHFRFNGCPMLYNIFQIEIDLTRGTQSNRDLLIEMFRDVTGLYGELEIIS